MRGNDRMKFEILLATLALVVCLSAPEAVNAFEQQNSGAPPPSASATSGDTVNATTQSPQNELSAPSGKSEEKGGTEVRIPGLGKLGELPNMDFGLELLYGAADSDVKVEDPQEPTANSDDIRIHGTIKHQF